MASRVEAEEEKQPTAEPAPSLEQILATLDVQERLLVPEAAGVAAQRPVGPHHAVARDDDRDGIPAERVAHGASYNFV